MATSGADSLMDLRGRTCLVTGGNAGIGLEVVRALARRGARVLIAARDPGRGEAARREIERTTGNGEVDVGVVDLSSQASLRAFAAEVLQRCPRLDVLVNNAGVWSTARRDSTDGIELTWATNQLGYFLLTELLLERLRSDGRARIVNVASELARDLDLTDVEFRRRPYSGLTAYAQSKQANRMWTWALARRLEGTGVSANALHPGGVATGIYRKGGGLRGMLTAAVARLAGRSPARGADTAVWLAASPEVEGRSGLFFVDRQERVCRFRDRTREDELWALCAAMTRPR